MKQIKIDFSKIKKVTLIEVIVLVIVLLGVGIFYSPHFIQKQEITKAAKIKANNAIFTSRALEEFAQNKNIKSSDVAKKLVENLNATMKNPYDKKKPAYTFEQNCYGCNSVSYDENAKMILLTAYNKKGELISRTVIKPPSFVVYSKYDEDK